MAGRPAAGGGRWVEVDPDRLPRWLAGFGERHGDPVASVVAGVAHLAGGDGARAELHPPPGAPSTADLDAFVRAAAEPRHLGLVLARQAAVAAGVAVGPRLVSSKVDSSYVQGRTAAGGWSQHRFARRRENQARAAAGQAADVVAAVLLPVVADLVAVVTGGNRRTVEAVLADPRLGAVRDRRAERFLDVPEPRRAVLERAVAAARAVRIRITDPA
jgi:hypothetical protein